MLKNWSKDLSIGNTELDRQHEKLFRLAHKAQLMANLQSTSRDEYHELLNDLAAALHTNFATEEKILMRKHCPAFAMHSAAHAAYQEKLVRILCAATRHIQDRDALLDTMSDLLENHIEKMDVPCKDCLKDFGPCRRAPD